LPVNTLVTFNPVTVAPGDSLGKVLRLMAEYEMHHLPVVDDDYSLLGIISDVDIARCLTLESPADDACDFSDALPSAAAVMTSGVVSLDVEMAPLVLLQEILSHDFHSVPVTSRGRLAGIVTATDFLREFAVLTPRAAVSLAAKSMSPWRPTIACDATPDDAQALMAAHHVRYLGVHDGAHPMGAVSARMVRRAHRLELLTDNSDDVAGLLMERSCPTLAAMLPEGRAVIDPLCSLAEAAAKLSELAVDGLAVVGAGDKVLGMLTETDLLKAMSLELARRA